MTPMTPISFEQAVWQAAREPLSMLKFLGDGTSARKLRLLIVAVVRRIWSRCNEAEHAALDTLERLADGQATPEDLERCRSQLAAPQSVYLGVFNRVVGFAADVERAPTKHTVMALLSVIDSASYLPGHFSMQRLHGADRAELKQAMNDLTVELVREVFGNPFEPVAFDPAWLHWNGGTVPALAQSIYDHRRFEELPILADALADAGCVSEQVRSHCLGPADHYRGCFVLDLILNRASGR